MGKLLFIVQLWVTNVGAVNDRPYNILATSYASYDARYNNTQTNVS